MHACTCHNVHTPMHELTHHISTTRGKPYKTTTLVHTAMQATSLFARFSVFSARVDRLQLLQIPYSDIVIPMSSLDNINFPATMTMLAFRCVWHAMCPK